MIAMHSLLLLASLVLVAVCGALNIEYSQEWELWKSIHSKRYNGMEEEEGRQRVWIENKKHIDQFNSNASAAGFTISLNKFADMSEKEFAQKYYCYRLSENNFTQYVEWKPPAFQSYPDSVDWRKKGAVSSVKDQGQCASCYAFSAMGALEGARSLAQKSSVSLSAQNVIDCSVPYGENGCNGGNMYDAYKYVISNDGIDTSSSYPYEGKQGQCRYVEANSGASMTGVMVIQSGQEEDLLAAVATIGPISVAVDATANTFRFYSGGVFDPAYCSSTNLTHSMLVTGYGVYKGKKYWLLKNSWGKSWGINGYIMMARNNYNQCGIATDASYPTL